MPPATRPTEPTDLAAIEARTKRRYLSSDVSVPTRVIEDVFALTSEVRDLRADRDWWKRMCWLALLLALVASGGWAWTVMR